MFRLAEISKNPNTVTSDDVQRTGDAYAGALDLAGGVETGPPVRIRRPMAVEYFTGVFRRQDPRSSGPAIIRTRD